jgi:hypothetical protein
VVFLTFSDEMEASKIGVELVLELVVQIMKMKNLENLTF